MSAKFPLYDYTGKPVRFFLVDQRSVSMDQTHVAPEVAHHVFIVDRSGSMYYDMKDMRAMLEKLLTIEEFRNSELLCSLISYSSQGDTTLHFERTKVEDIMKPGSAAIESVRKLQVTGLTCISQALEQAKSLIRDETTCISLHSDGYANDRSSVSERRQINMLCKEFQQKPNVFINTIAYRSSSDFKLLSSIANACSGKCLLAKTVKEVYDALHDTSALLAGQMSPATQLKIGLGDYQVFVSGSAGRVNGASKDMIIRGLKPDDDRTVWNYLEVDKDLYLEHIGPICGDDCPETPILAFAQAKLAEGQLNEAKFAMMSTRRAELIKDNYRALTNIELASFYEDLDTHVMRDLRKEAISIEKNDFFGLGMHKIDLLSLTQILSEHAKHLTVDMSDLYDHYTKRGLESVPGVRQEDGSVLEPEYDTRYVGDTKTAKVGRFELNRNTASLQMLLVRPVELVKRNDRDGSAITKVAGIDLTGANALHAYNNYTLVGDGTLNVSRLKVKIDSKKAFRALVKAEVISGDYQPDSWYTLELSDLPLVDFSHRFDVMSGVFEDLAKVKVFSSILSALLKGHSERFTDEQLTELRAHGLSGNLYVNFPSTRTYSSLQDALAKGEVDTRPSYNIDIGSTSILHLGQFKSANANLQRFFTCEVDGVMLKKPTWSDWWTKGVAGIGGASFGYKKLTARTKITPIDELMKPILEDFLGLNPNSEVRTILTTVGADAIKISQFEAGVLPGNIDPDDAVELITEMNKLCHAYTESVYTERIRPLVFYIGATGLIPEDLETQALTAEVIAERYPLLKLGNAEKEGTFFDLGSDVVLSVYIKDVYFATNRDMEAAA